MNVRCYIVDDIDTFYSLAKPWADLATRARVHPFQEFCWHDNWFSTLGIASNYRLNIAVLYEGERLLGVLPLVRRFRRSVRLLEWSGNDVSNYSDVIIDPEIDTKFALEKLWNEVLINGGFDIARLNYIRSDAVCAGFFRRNHYQIRIDNTYVLPIKWNDGCSWLESQHAKFRRGIRRRNRRLTEAGITGWSWSSPEPKTAALNALVTQKRHWLDSKRYPSFLNKPAGLKFIHRMADSMDKLNALCLSGLKINDDFVACDLGIVRHGVFYAILKSYDQSWSNYGLGQILLAHRIMWCCDQGIAKCDMLEGGSYKRHLIGCQTDSLGTYVLPGNILGRAIVLAHRIKTSLPLAAR